MKAEFQIVFFKAVQQRIHLVCVFFPHKSYELYTVVHREIIMILIPNKKCS